MCTGEAAEAAKEKVVELRSPFLFYPGGTLHRGGPVVLVKFLMLPGVVFDFYLGFYVQNQIW